jgi:hypothetical protein
MSEADLISKKDRKKAEVQSMSLEAFVQPASSEAEEADLPEKGSKRWYVCIAFVISGMIFNGAIYGYTSPALPSFKKAVQAGHNMAAEDSFFQELFPK